MMNSHEGYMFLGGAYMWAVWLLLILAVFWLIKYFISAVSLKNTETQAIKILDQHYAKGDLNTHEYQTIKQQLMKHSNQRGEIS